MSKPARTLSQMVNEEMMQGEEFEIALFKLLKMAPWSNHRVGISVTPQSKDVDMKPMGEKRWSVDFEDKAAKISFRPLNRR